MPSIFDDLRAGLTSLLDRVAGDDDGPVPNVGYEQLRAELTRRAAERTEPAADVHPIARRAAANQRARTIREQMASRRQERVHQARAEQERVAQAARDAAFEEVKRRAQAESTWSSGPMPGSEQQTRSRPRRRPGGDPELAKHYQTLGVPFGSDFPTVKAAFRKLMRRYHPDMHSATPEKQRAAAELSKQLTVAYNALEGHLQGK
jgi:hypothetical protein